MKRSSVFLLVFFHCINAFAQTPFVEFTELFPAMDYPACFDYSHEEKVAFGAVYHTDTIYADDSSEYELEEVYEENDLELTGVSRSIDPSDAKQYLLPPDSVYGWDLNRENRFNGQTVDEYNDKSSFYGLSSMSAPGGFYLLAYERFFGSGGILSSEKFICTIRDGKFVDRLCIASFVFAGTGTGGSGGKVPWFPEETGCIASDMTIEVQGYADTYKYIITKEGRFLRK